MAENDQSPTHRTETARDHDDSDIIDAAVEQGEGGVVGRAGGALGRDVGTQDEMKRAVEDPDGHTRATKQDDIDANVAYPSDSGPNR